MEIDAQTRDAITRDRNTLLLWADAKVSLTLQELAQTIRRLDVNLQTVGL